MFKRNTPAQQIRSGLSRPPEIAQDFAFVTVRMTQQCVLRTAKNRLMEWMVG